MLLGHHGIDPALAPGGDDVDRGFQRVALEALGLEDLPDLLTLTLGVELNMALFHAARLLVFVDFGLGARIVGGGHGKSVGKEVARAEDQHHAGRQIGADHAGHDGEAVDAAIDPVAEIADLGTLLQAPGDLARVMAMFEGTMQSGSFQGP